MPFGDGTGPRGLGPMTGRAAGYCAGFDVPGYANPGFGRGFYGGWGRGYGGGGRGRRNRYYATGLPGWARAGYAPAWGAPPYAPPAMPQEQETAMLKAQAEALSEQLEAINRRLEKLAGESSTE